MHVAESSAAQVLEVADVDQRRAVFGQESERKVKVNFTARLSMVKLATGALDPAMQGQAKR